MANHQNAGNAGLYNAAGGLNGMPSAGHYSDMQTLMQNMETLSGWLQQNREDFLSVQDGLEQVERRNVGHSFEALDTRLGSQKQDSDIVHRLDTQQAYPHCLLSMENIQHNVRPNPMCNPRSALRATRPLPRKETNIVTLSLPESPPDPSAPTITSLQRALDAAQSRIQTYEKAADEHQRLQAVYEDTLTEATERIRNYVYQQNDHLTSLHKHYTHLLQESRGETVQAQQIHQDWQRSLSKLNEELRRAVQAREDEKRPFTRKVAALREENRVLRGLAGWEPAEEGSSEEEGEVEVVTAAESRGRGARERERVVGQAMGQMAGK